MPKGEKNKLNAQQKTEIRALKNKVSAYDVAHDYGISHTMVYKLWRQAEERIPFRFSGSNMDTGNDNILIIHGSGRIKEVRPDGVHVLTDIQFEFAEYGLLNKRSSLGLPKEDPR